jgi:hypothetical protein
VEDSVAQATPEAEEAEDRWVFMIDPAWQPREEDDEPPVEAVVGGWYVEADGTTGLFRPNPVYEPSQPDFPTDPVDAALQLLVRGETDGDEVLSSMHDVLFGIALDDDGSAVVTPAPDDVPSVLVTTSPPHRARVNTENWAEVTVAELAEALPEEGVDVLLNPGAPASMRVLASAVKRSVREPASAVDTQAGPDTQARPETQAGPDAQAGPETQARPDAQAGPETQAGPDTQTSAAE